MTNDRADLEQENAQLRAMVERLAAQVGEQLERKITFRTYVRHGEYEFEATASGFRLEELSDALHRKGCAPLSIHPPRAQFGGPGRKRPEVPPPFVDAQGRQCCPYHKVPLRSRDFGMTCAQELKEGDEHARQQRNGSRFWCNYVWDSNAKKDR